MLLDALALDNEDVQLLLTCGHGTEFPETSHVGGIQAREDWKKQVSQSCGPDRSGRTSHVTQCHGVCSILVFNSISIYLYSIFYTDVLVITLFICFL